MIDVHGPETREVPITLVIHMTQTVRADASEEDARFYIEENHCLQNYVRELHDAEEPGVCNLCSHANAFVGHIPFESVVRPGALRTCSTTPILTGELQTWMAAVLKEEELHRAHEAAHDEDASAAYDRYLASHNAMLLALHALTQKVLSKNDK